jgi:hypothetical protein
MSALEDTIAAWTVEAASDMAAPTTKLVAKWIARVAHAKGRAVLGERALKKLEADDDACRFRGLCGGTDAAMQIAMQHAPGDIAMGQARAEYAAGIELAEVAERVLAAMSRPRAAAKQEEKPRFVAQQGGKR